MIGPFPVLVNETIDQVDVAEWHKAIQEATLANFNRNSILRPVANALCRHEGKHAMFTVDLSVMMQSSLTKQALAPVLADILRYFGAYTVVVSTEAWMAMPKETEVDMTTPVSERPDRKEVVMVQYETLGKPGRMEYFDIARDADGNGTVAAEPSLTFHDSAFGFLTDLLKQMAPMAEA